MTIELRHLRTIIAAADAGSLTSAAIFLGVEVSSVSRMIHGVEDELGVSIFERLAKGVRLTEAGRDYVAAARVTMARLDDAAQQARLVGAGQIGQLTIGFVWPFAHGPIVSHLRTYRSVNPQVRLQLVEADSDALMAKLFASTLDLALLSVAPNSNGEDEITPWDRLPLWSEAVYFATGEQDDRKKLTWDEMAGATLLCRRGYNWSSFARFVESIGGPSLHFVEHDTSLEGLIGLVAAGFGWTPLPRSMANISVAGVRVVPVTSPGALQVIEARWLQSTDNPALRRWIAQLKLDKSTARINSVVGGPQILGLSP